MRLEINNKKKCEQFNYIFTNLKYFTDKVVLHISDEKIYLQGMDNNHICVYELTLTSSWFTKYEVTESETICIPLGIFTKILHIHNEKQYIIIYNDDNDNLDIEYKTMSSESKNENKDENKDDSGLCKGVFDKYFRIPLMDMDTDMMHIPDTDYEVDIEMDSTRFKGLIDELSNFNETLNIGCDENNVTLESTSIEGSMKTVINMDDIELLAVVEDKEVNTSFGIKYIANMCQFHKISSNCSIHISEGMPLMMKYEMDDDCHIQFHVAPKIMDD